MPVWGCRAVPGASLPRQPSPRKRRTNRRQHCCVVRSHLQPVVSAGFSRACTHDENTWPGQPAVTIPAVKRPSGGPRTRTILGAGGSLPIVCGSVRCLHGGLGLANALRPATTPGDQAPTPSSRWLAQVPGRRPCLQHLTVGCHDGQACSIALSVATRPSASFGRWAGQAMACGLWPEPVGLV
jgi:hypothetical protein